MSFKDTLKKSWKYLPGISVIEYNSSKEESEIKCLVKELGHVAYAFGSAGLIVGFLAGSFIAGTPNVTRWSKIAEQRERAEQEYNELYRKAAQCVEKDRVDGLNLNELTELYSRAGMNLNVNPNLDPQAVTFRLPRLTRENLEKVVKSCELPVI